MTTSHQINETVANEDRSQAMTGWFMHRPWDIVTLTGFQVDVYIMMQPPPSECLYLNILVTNSNGYVSYTIPETYCLEGTLLPHQDGGLVCAFGGASRAGPASWV